MCSSDLAPVPPISLNGELPTDFERIINKALEKDRDLRVQTAAELCADLKRLRRDTDSARSASVTAVGVYPRRGRGPPAGGGDTGAGPRGDIISPMAQPRTRSRGLRDRARDGVPLSAHTSTAADFEFDADHE